MIITIRKAERQDCKSLLELIKELAVYEKAPDEVTVSLAHFEESGFGEKPVWWAFTACPTAYKGGENNEPDSEQKIIGFALYYIRYSTWKGQCMYLEDIVVTEEARGKGIGKLLFDALIEEAKEKKISGIMWQVLNWNEPAINFYRKYYNAKFDDGWMNCSLEIV